MGTYEDKRLIREIFVMQLELKRANEESWARGRLSEQSFFAVNSELNHIDNRLRSIIDSIQQVVFSIDSQLPLVISHLARAGEFLENIMNSVQNPAAIRADELRRHGLLAFKNGWTIEAIIEFQKSIEVYKYDPSVHFALGYALFVVKDYYVAADSFCKSARYGFPVNHSLATSAAISAANLYDGTGANQQAVDILLACHKTIPNAADIAYELARRTGERQHLTSALSLKPSLVVQARAESLARLEDSSRDALYGPAGFAGLQAAAAFESAKLSALLQEEGKSIQKVLPLPDSPSASACLFFFAEQLPLTRERLSSAIAEVRSCAIELSENACNSLQDSKNTGSVFAKPVAPEQSNYVQHVLARPVVWGTVAMVMLAAFFFFLHLLEGKIAALVIISFITLIGSAISGRAFIWSIGQVREKTRVNATARRLMDDYRKRFVTYEIDSRRAADVKAIANEAARKATAFNYEMQSIILAATEVRKRLDWSIVEPVIIPVTADTKGLNTK